MCGGGPPGGPRPAASSCFGRPHFCVLPAGRPAQQQKADVVFAAENEVIPSIIDDSKEKALTGEDHSGRNLLNIIVFGGIALIILLVLLIKM